jgi:hypothetical protein
MDSGGACFCTGIKLEKLQKGTKGFISDIIPVSTAGQGPYRTQKTLDSVVDRLFRVDTVTEENTARAGIQPLVWKT